jgi:hypothetical protein
MASNTAPSQKMLKMRRTYIRLHLRRRSQTRSDASFGINTRQQTGGDMAINESEARDPAGRRPILGVLWIAYGILRLIVAVGLVMFSGTATLMFGALLTRVANPFALMADFHMIYTATIALSILCGVLGILAGLAFLGSQQPPRVLGLLAGFFSVSEVPFGTTLGIYTLIILLRRT